LPSWRRSAKAWSTSRSAGDPAALLTPPRIRALLADHNLRPRRRLGQHFLADPNTARRIVRLAAVEAGDRVLEIGPGLGSLSLALAEAGAQVVALEVDPALAAVVRELTADLDVRVEVGDALTAELAALLDGDGWRCVSNLPYNVAAPVVVRVLEETPGVERLLVMVQREVGERLAAPPGTDAASAVSVVVAYHGAAEIAGVVPPTVFVPQPKVESALVRIVRHADPPVAVPSPDALSALVRAGFGQRRKMLRRALRAALGDRTETVLAQAGIEGTTRAERLTLDEWAALARAAA
jgi:16S rRNA (adenine1518-N6/adenine1519-N6)-dimethyltransferase